jgi:hypothetical protein
MMSSPDRRLLLGYGPAVVIIAAFLAMALLVPTVAPEHDVAVTASTPNAVSTQVVTTPAAAGNGPATVSGTHVTSNGPAATTANQPQGAPAPTGGTTTGCAGLQVPGDPYSPPCVTFSGNNGGATYRGVTDKTILVTYMNPTDGSVSVDQQIASVIGHYDAGVFPETYAQVLQTMQDLVTYFNRHFQFYGRQIVLKVFNGQEVSAGTNQSQVNSDAIDVADTIKAFAETNATSEVYQDALSAQGVLNLGGNYLSQDYYASKSPYAWGNAPDCTALGQEVGAVAVKQLLGRPVSYAGTGVSNGQTRRFAVISPDTPEFKKCGGYISTALSQAGHPATVTIAYSDDASQAAATTQGIAQQIVNDKITTILCLCDSVMQLLVGGDLDNANYLPEWFNAAVLAEESDVIAQQEDQAAWGHVALLTNEIAVPGKYGSTIAYFAAKSVDPNGFVVNEVDVIYQKLYQLALGIQMAGPDLTPQTFAQGLWNYQGGDGVYGPWSYNQNGVHYYTPIRQFRLQWYDPKKISDYDGAHGAWDVDPTWYTIADLPSGPSPVYPNGGL